MVCANAALCSVVGASVYLRLTGWTGLSGALGPLTCFTPKDAREAPWTPVRTADDQSSTPVLFSSCVVINLELI